MKAGLNQDLSSARKEIATTIRSEITPGGKKARKKAKFAPRAKGQSLKNSTGAINSRIIKHRKKSAASLLD